MAVDRTYLLRLSVLLFACFSIHQSSAQQGPHAPAPLSPSSSLCFIENKGQWLSDVRYLARLGGMDAWVTDRGIVYDFYRYHPKSDGAALPTPSLLPAALHRNGSEIADAGYRSGHVVAMEFVGGAGRVVAESWTKRIDYHNYFLGRDSTQWARRVRLYGSVRLAEIYPGIDAVLRFDGGSLRYDLHVGAGSDPSVIRLKFAGADGIRVNERGELVLATSVGEVVQGSLYGYQEIGGVEQRVEIGFRRMEDGEVGFLVGSYDRRYPLVIDPLVYCTYLGGPEGAYGNAIAIDRQGNAYITGHTLHGDYPTTIGAYDISLGSGGWSDIVVTKLNPSGTGLIFSTYIGGVGRDEGTDIALNGENAAYITGRTVMFSQTVNDFPVTSGAFDVTFNGEGDIVFCILSPDGTDLEYSTFLGGTGSDANPSLALDRSDNVYLSGWTLSSDFPITSNAFRPFPVASPPTVNGEYEGFVAKLDVGSSTLLYSTCIGRVTNMTNIAVDSAGEAFIGGAAYLSDFPVTPSAFDRTLGGDADAFVMKLNRDGSAPVYSTLVGGGEWDQAHGLAIDSLGNAYIVGRTHSSDFPVTPEAFEKRFLRGGSGFVVKLNREGTGLLYSTFLSVGPTQDTAGDFSELLSAVAVDRNNNAVITGTCSWEGYPTTPGAFNETHNRSLSGGGAGVSDDAIITRLDSSGSSLLYSTYFGDSVGDNGKDIAVDSLGEIYCLGNTQRSLTFPVTPGAFDTVPVRLLMTGYYKIFVAKLGGDCSLTVDLGPDTALCPGSSVRLLPSVANGIPPFTYKWSSTTGSLSDSMVVNPLVSPSVTGQYIITVRDRIGCYARDTITVAVYDPPVADAGADTVICYGESVILKGEAVGERPPFTYLWDPPLALSDPAVPHPVASPKTTVRYVLTVIDASGCQHMNTVDIIVRPQIKVDAGPDVLLCSGEEGMIGREAQGESAPYSYSWEPSHGLSQSDIATPIAHPAETTTYRLTVTDRYGCQVTDSIRVVVGAFSGPTIGVEGSPEFCAGDSVMLDGGDGYASYRWSNGESTQRIVVKEGGRYSVAVSNAEGCTGHSDTVDVTVSPFPDVAVTGPRAVCADGTGIYSVKEEANTTYEWRLESANGVIQSGEGTNSVTVKWGAPESAVLHLTARDEVSGCVDSADYAITVGSELKPVISGPGVICAGQSVELDAGDGYVSYAWSTGETTRTITVSEGTSVTVRVTDAGGCSGESDEFVVTQKNRLEVKLTPGGDVPLCEGGEQIITAPAGYAGYLWSTGETTATITVTQPGEYWVEVTDADGCMGRSDTARVVRSDDGVKLTPGGALSLCAGDSLRLAAPSGYASYTWSTGETTSSIIIKAAGAYWVGVEGSGGCVFFSDTAQVRVVPPPQPVIVRVGNRLRSSPAATYQWLRDGVEIVGATEQEFTIAGPGEYGVRVTNIEGCVGQSATVPGASPRVVWLDTVEGNVGEGLWLRLRVDPPLSSADGVTGYRAWLRLAPEALYPREVTPGGEITYDGYGRVAVRDDMSGQLLTGAELFGVQLLGFVTGQPENVVAVDSVELVGLGRAAVAGAGLVVLHGCELGGRFAKGVRIVSITPNPAGEEVEILYYAPEQEAIRLRLRDLLGRTVIEPDSEPGTGREKSARLRVADLPDGLYLMELRDSEGTTTAPLLIQR